MRIGVVVVVGLVLYLLFHKKQAAEAAQLGTSGSTTLGIAELYFDPGVDFPADPITGDVRTSKATP